MCVAETTEETSKISTAIQMLSGIFIWCVIFVTIFMVILGGYLLYI